MTTGLILPAVILFILVLGCGSIRQSSNQGSIKSVSSTPSPTPASTPDAQKHLKEWMELTRRVDRKGDLIVNATLDPGSQDKLIITVSNQWHTEPYQTRLQGAQMFWRTWAMIHSPDRLDTSRISIVDRMGNEVGGSRIIAGSMIWVQEN
jgi:hypothetical protein